MNRFPVKHEAGATRSISAWLALSVVLFFVVVAVSPARAAIIPTGDVDPSNPSAWDSSTTGYIGATAAGTLTVNGGDDLLSGESHIGYGAAATSIVNIAGTGSTWTNSRCLCVGGSGSGTLSISGGGAVNNGSDVYIGHNEGSTGMITVDGAGSTCSITYGGHVLDVGEYGGGTLSIAAGGAVSSGTGLIGSQRHFVRHGQRSTAPARPGPMTINSMSAIAAAGRSRSPTAAPSATPTATSAATVGSTGAVTVDGAGSTWTNNDAASLSATVAAERSRSPPAAPSAIRRASSASNGGSSGTVTVDGAGSTWTNLGDLSVGKTGSGTLSISSGGAVSNCCGLDRLQQRLVRRGQG